MRNRMLTGCWLLLGTLLVSACPDRNPDGPSQSGFRQIAVTGPQSVAPGATGQFTATGIHWNGDSEDLTSRATWTAVSKSPQRTKLEPSPFIRFGSIPGLATGIALGDATVQALYGGNSSTPVDVFVLPPGTFRLAGTTSDGPDKVQSATVEILSGVGGGMVTTTNPWGEFVFYGVRDSVVLQVSAPDYESTSRTITVSANRIENFELRPLVPPASLAGTWDLSITMPAGCRSVLPAEMQTRQTVATITQSSSFFNLVTPLMAAARPPQVSGRILGKNFSLNLPSYDAEIEHNYWEEFIGTAFFSLSGALIGTADDGVVHGTFNGFAGYQSTSTSSWQSCNGSDGSFLMTRREPGE